jgi:Lar family restriction alleviation protein
MDTKVYVKPEPCPFCGNKKLNRSDVFGEVDDIRVHCFRCCAHGPFSSSVPGAIALWNKRKQS